MEGEIITMSEIFKFDRRGIDENGQVVGSFRPTGLVPNFQERLAKRGLGLPLSLYDPDAYPEANRHGR
jgi:pilus assembly protein CpaF